MNTNKTFIVGDIHGCYYTFLNLLQKLPSDARIVLVGDLCDRGSHTKELLEYIITHKNIEAVLGNHDNYMMHHAIESLTNPTNRWIVEAYMGGQATLKSYGEDIQTLQRHIQFLQTLPLYKIIENKYFITHGFGLPYFKRRDIQSQKIREGLLKNRLTDEKEWGETWEKEWDTYGMINVFGHTDYEKVKVHSCYYGIDTGCVFGRKLTALELGSMKTTSVPCDTRDVEQ